MSNVIKDFCAFASRKVRAGIGEYLLGQETGKYTRLKERHMRVMVRNKFMEMYDLGDHEWHTIAKDHGLDKRQEKSLRKKLRSALNELFKSELRKKQEDFDLERYIEKKQDHKVEKVIKEVVPEAA